MKELSVVVTRMDLLAFHFRVFRERPVNRWTFLLVFVFCFLTAQSRAPAFNARYLVISIVVGLVFTTGAILFGFLLTIVLALLGRKAHQGTLGEHTFSITERGLVESSRHHETLIKWGGALSLVRTRRFIYVQLSARLYLLIPRRYFANAGDDERFWDVIQPLLAKS